MNRTLTALAVLGSAAFATTAFAQNEPSAESFQINTLTCFEVISLPAEDATFMMGMLLGYAAAEGGMMDMSAASVVEKVEAFDATCGENPDMSALEAMS